jgi:cytochrome d ubiquinol oxidase subunit I
MEGLWKTQRGAPFVIFGLPDEETQSNDFSIEIPKALSLMLTDDLDGLVLGINAFTDTPPVFAVFWSFRVMLSVGLLMLLLSWWTSFYLIRKKPLRLLNLKALTWMTFSGWLAIIAGWFVTEIGRQPWLVYGLLKTADTVADHPPEQVLITIIGYAVLYIFLMVSFIMTLRYLASRPLEVEGCSFTNQTN